MSINPSDINSFVKETYENTQCDLIVVTEDKLEIILGKFKSNVKKSKDWITPLSIFLTVLIGVTTSDVNKKIFGIEKEVVTAFFYFALVGSFIWTIISIIIAINNGEQSKIEYTMKKIKNFNQPK